MKADNWRAANGSSRVRGSFDLILDSGMIIRGCTLVDGRQGDFVSLPQRSYEKGGKTTYSAIVDFTSQERGQKFYAAAIAAVKALRAEKSEAS